MSHDLRASIRRARQRKASQGTADDIRGYVEFAAQQRAEELFKELMDEMRRMGIAEIKKIASTVKKGDPGEPGKSIRGIPGPAGKGLKGDPGKDGVGKKGDKGEPGKDGRDIKKSELLKLINAIDGGIKISTIAGLDAWLKNLQRAIREKVVSGKMTHGGGMTLTAGTNVTLTRNNNGTWTISSSGGGASSIATEQLTPTQSGTDITLDLTALAHTQTAVLFVTRSGQVLMPNGNANLPGSSWSKSGSTVTVYNADDTDVYLVQYTY